MVNLNPFPGALPTLRLKGNYVVLGELEICSLRSRESHAHTTVTDAGEHLLADEIGEKAGHFSCFHAREFQQHGVKDLLVAQIDGGGGHDMSS